MARPQRPRLCRLPRLTANAPYNRRLTWILASKGDGGNPGRSAGWLQVWASLRCRLPPMALPKLARPPKPPHPNFLEFVRLTPMASRIQINLRDGQLCIENLESGRDYDFQLLAGAPFEPKAGQVVKTRAILSTTIEVRDIGTSLEFAQSGFVLAKGVEQRCADLHHQHE